ncbi:MAG: ABC transporter permease [Gammaproteobacteria bacterium]|nr:MAG: ABC transporter permease [Gammaproteobacteria bacterium]
MKKTHLIALYTIAHKEIRRFTRIWIQTLIPPVITTSLYFLIFGHVIGSRIGTMQGYQYMNYIVPGLILMSVIQHSYSNVSSSFYSTKFQHSIEELLIAPVPNWIILTGFVIGGMARGLLVGLIVACVTFFFTHITVQHIWIAIAIACLTSLLFSLAGFTNAMLAKSFDDISIIPTFVLSPLIYLGGVFFSIHLLPDFWYRLSLANPILHMVNAFRYGIIGSSDVPVITAFLIVTAAIVILLSINLVMMERGTGLKS